MPGRASKTNFSTLSADARLRAVRPAPPTGSGLRPASAALGEGFPSIIP